MWRGVSRLVSALAKVKDEPWSVRVLATLGLLLAVVSAIEQGFFLANLKSNDTWDRWSGWLVFVLTSLLLLVSAWFAADMRQIRRWSSASGDFRARLSDIAALHPDLLAPTLASVHDPDRAEVRAEELRQAVAVAGSRYNQSDLAPTLGEIERVEAAAAAALTPTLPHREPTWLRTDASDVGTTWQTIARLHSAATESRIELSASQSLIRKTGGRGDDEIEDPRNRWAELVTLATILLGLVAAPALADEMSGADNNGQDPTETEIVRLLERIAGPVERPGQTEESVEGLLSEISRSLDGIAASFDQDDLASLAADVKAIREREIDEAITIGIELIPGSEQGPGVDTETPEATTLEINEGNTLWQIANEHCAQENGSALEIVADVVSLWDANTRSVGDDPDEIEARSIIKLECAD